MALQLAYDDLYGGMNPLAYLRILRVELGREPLTIEILVGIYKDAAARNGGKLPLATKVFTPPTTTADFTDVGQDVAGMNSCNAGYLYMKTLPEFALAVNV